LSRRHLVTTEYSTLNDISRDDRRKVQEKSKRESQLSQVICHPLGQLGLTVMSMMLYDNAIRG
jgi:hypothetical protein